MRKERTLAFFGLLMDDHDTTIKDYGQRIVTEYHQDFSFNYQFTGNTEGRGTFAGNIGDR